MKGKCEDCGEWCACFVESFVGVNPPGCIQKKKLFDLGIDNFEDVMKYGCEPCDIECPGEVCPIYDGAPTY
jgi:hypothetical protein